MINENCVRTSNTFSLKVCVITRECYLNGNQPIAFLGECDETDELKRTCGDMKNTAMSRRRNSSTSTEENYKDMIILEVVIQYMIIVTHVVFSTIHILQITCTGNSFNNIYKMSDENIVQFDLIMILR